MIDDQDSRPFDGPQGRESLDIARDHDPAAEWRVERIPGVKDSSEILKDLMI